MEDLQQMFVTTQEAIWNSLKPIHGDPLPVLALTFAWKGPEMLQWILQIDLACCYCFILKGLMSTFSII